MGFWSIIFLMGVVVLSATISAVFGLAGGAVFFSALVWVVDAKVAIPIHSGVQLISNFSRIGVYFKQVQWHIVLWFAILLIPGAYLGSMLFSFFNTSVMEGLVGLFIIITAFLPKSIPLGRNKGSYMFIGFVSSFLGMIVAVTGPLIAAFLNMSEVKKEKMVATKSVCQGMTQLVKVIIFATVIEFDFGEYLLPLTLFGLMAIVGTFIGKKIIGKISNQLYDKLNKWLLIIIGINMLVKAFLG